jgi:hypothetical protein
MMDFQAGTDDGYRVESPRLLAVLALAALVSALAACGGEPPLVEDTLRLVAEGSVGGTRWAVLATPGGAVLRAAQLRRRVGETGMRRRPAQLQVVPIGLLRQQLRAPANRGWIVFEAVPERVAKVQVTVARYPRTTTTFDVYHPAGPRPVTRTLEARTIERPGLPARYWALVTPPGFDVPPRGALTFLDANGHKL